MKKRHFSQRNGLKVSKLDERHEASDPGGRMCKQDRFLKNPFLLYKLDHSLAAVRKNQK